MMLLLFFFRVCSKSSSSGFISVHLHILHCWWKYLCWLNVSAAVYNKIYSITNLGWAPFSLVCTNQARTTHHISPCSPCLCWPLHSGLMGHRCQRYTCVDPTQEATGSLTSLPTSLWSRWQPWLPQQASTQSSLFSWPLLALSCPPRLWLWNSLIPLFSPERDYLSYSNGFEWEE